MQDMEKLAPATLLHLKAIQEFVQDYLATHRERSPHATRQSCDGLRGGQSRSTVERVWCRDGRAIEGLRHWARKGRTTGRCVDG